MDIIQFAAETAHADHGTSASDDQNDRPLYLLDVSRRELREDDRATERALVGHSLRSVTTAAQRRVLSRGAGLAAIIRVPSPAWVAPVARVMRGSGEWGHIYEAPVARRRSPEDTSDRTVANGLAYGLRVLGISPDPETLLPAALLAACDLHVDLPQPSASVMMAVVRGVLGYGGMPAEATFETGGLDLPDLIAAIRRNSTAAECLARLERARAYRLASDPGVADAPLLDDLHGYGEAMDWCRDLLADLAEWRAGRIAFPNGSARAVLSGPPGTGKTSLVRALGRAAGMPVVASSVASWFTTGSGHLDGVLREINATWERARAVAPAIVLLDELDAVPSRAGMEQRDRTWWTTVVTHLLLSLDSACSGVTQNLVIVGATNYAHLLDEALVRPGRLERILHVHPPNDPETRLGILRSHLAGELASDDLVPVAIATAGTTGADLMGLVRDARRRARVEGRTLEVRDLLAVAVPPSRRTLAQDRVCAVHEAGHAVVATVLGMHVAVASLVEGGVSLASVHIARDGAGIETRSDLERQACALLAGLAAEELILGARTSGAGGSPGSDLAQATRLFASMHGEQGLGRWLTYRPATAGRLDPDVADDVERDLQRAYSTATLVLAEHRAAVLAVASRLLSERVLSGDAIRAVVGENKPRLASARDATLFPKAGATPA